MSLAKNSYYELNSKGKLELKQASQRSIDELHSAFLNLTGYRKISNHLIELMIDNEKQIVGIFRLVPEGNNKEQYRKRIQISKFDLPSMPNFIICVYLNGGLCYYIKFDDLESIKNLPKNTTTLFRLDIRMLQKFLSKKIARTTVISRGQKVEIVISQHFNFLLSENILKEERKLDCNFSFGRNFDSLINIESMNKNEINEEIDKKEIGRVCEEIVYKNLLDMKSKMSLSIREKMQIKNLIWINKNKEQSLPYDLKTDNFFIEVKGSIHDEDFFLSANEFNFSQSHANNYVLIKLDSINIEKRTFENFKLYYPSDLAKMEMKIMSYKMKENENGNK